jgi:hypothetical protein
MTAPGPTPAALVVETDPAPTDPAPAVTPEATPKPAPPAKRSLEDSLASLDEDTRTFVLAEVQKARREAGDARGTAQGASSRSGPHEMAQQVGKALGLIKDDEATDPAKLTEQLTTVGNEARQAKVELAVYRAAAAVGGDPAALLDSRTFLTSLADVDPTDSAAVTAAITAACEANPALKAAPTRRVPAPNPAIGSSASGAPGIDDQIAAAKKAGDVKTWMHLENQKLAAPSR